MDAIQTMSAWATVQTVQPVYSEMTAAVRARGAELLAEAYADRDHVAAMRADVLSRWTDGDETGYRRYLDEVRTAYGPWHYPMDRASWWRDIR